jgi:hypothetical protein
VISRSSSRRSCSDYDNSSRHKEDGERGEGSVVCRRLALVNERRPLGTGCLIARRWLRARPDRDRIEQGDDRCLGGLSGTTGAASSRSGKSHKQTRDRECRANETHANNEQSDPPTLSPHQVDGRRRPSSSRPIHSDPLMSLESCCGSIPEMECLSSQPVPSRDGDGRRQILDSSGWSERRIMEREMPVICD